MSRDDDTRLTRDEKRKMGRYEAETAENLCEAMLAMRPEALAKLDVDPVLRDAVAELRTLFAKKQRPRHLRYVQRLIRESDLESIREAIEAAELESGDDPLIRSAERWRDRLVSEGDAALVDYLDTVGSSDRTALRQAVSRAKAGKTPEERARATRDVFDRVREDLARDLAERGTDEPG